MVLDYVRSWLSIPIETGGIVRLDNLHSSHIKTTRKVCSLIKDTSLDVPIIGEYFGDSNSLHEFQSMGLDAILATQWDYPFCADTKNLLHYIHSSDIKHFLPISSHDSASPTQMYGGVCSTLPRYALSALMGDDLYGLTMFNEFGYDNKTPFIGSNLQKIPRVSVNFINYFRSIDERAKDFFGKPSFLVDHPAIIGVMRNNHFALINLDTLHEEVYDGMRLPPCGVLVDNTLFSLKNGCVLEEKLS